MTDRSFTTAIAIGCEDIRCIEPGIDNTDPSLLCGADRRNRSVYLIYDDQTFDVHFSQLDATIASLSALRDAIFKVEVK